MTYLTSVSTHVTKKGRRGVRGDTETVGRVVLHLNLKILDLNRQIERNWLL